MTPQTVERFQGKTLAEVYQRVKARLGPDAVILRVEHVNAARKGGAKANLVEVEAASAPHPGQVPPSRLPRQPLRMPTSEPARGWSFQGDVNTQASTGVAPPPSRWSGERSKPADGLYRAYLSLISAQVSQELAERLVSGIRSTLNAQELEDEARVRQMLREVVALLLRTDSNLPAPETGGRGVAAVVGSPGVGKTTSLIKLAAAEGKRRSVALVTLDALRVGAADQMRSYARVLGLPWFAAATTEEFADGLRKMAGCDLILVDTPGIPVGDEEGLTRLRAFFERMAPDQIHLVVPATAAAPVLRNTMDWFQATRYDRILPTHLDEVLGLGVLLDCLTNVDARLSYLSRSPDPATRLQIPEPSWIAERIVAGARESAWVK